MSGGSLTAGQTLFGDKTGTFTQTGGTHSILNSLDVGYASGSSGTYSLSGTGLLTAAAEYIGTSGTATFTHSGGTNTIASDLYLAHDDGAKANYSLSDAGELSAATEYIGYYGAGILTQTSGTNSATYVKVGYRGTYTLSGGTLNIGGGFDNAGTWDLQNSSAVINAPSSIINLSGTMLAAGGHVALNLDAHSLLIVPSGHSPSEYFTNITNPGLVHTTGSALHIPAANTIRGVGSISDHVNCDGTLSATSGRAINLNSGLTISNSGAVSLGAGDVHVNDASSGMDSGSLNAANNYVGYSNTGTFTQTGGANSVTDTLYIGGILSSCSGSYALSGIGQLSAQSEIIGLHGSGTFTQTGGTNTVSNTLSLGPSQFGSTGSYELSGMGQLSTMSTVVGDGFGGIFTQSGGTHSVSNGLLLGNNLGSGSYIFNGGTLILNSLGKGSGSALFYFGGGTLRASGDFATSLPMTLSGSGGDATIDTAGYSVLCAGILSGSGGLIKTGSGTLTLSAGTNTYSGITTVNAGSLQAVRPSALPGFSISGRVVVNSGGTMAVNAGGASEWIATAIASLLSHATFNPGSTLAIDTTTANFMYGNAIAGNRGLTKFGSNTLTLSALNSYSGVTTIKGGTLEFDGGIAPSGTSLIDIQSGTAAFKTTPISKSSLNINTAASTIFEIISGAHTIGAISGSGTTKLDAGARLTATSISQGTITLAAGSTLAIAAIPGGPSGLAITPVPEPSAVVLLAAAFIAAMCGWARKAAR